MLFEDWAKLYIPSTLNNSNETHTFMCLGRAGCFEQANTHTIQYIGQGKNTAG